MNKAKINPPETGYIRLGPVTFEQSGGMGVKPCDGRTFEKFESKAHADQYDAQQRAAKLQAAQDARAAARDRVKAKAAQEPKPAPGILPAAENMTIKRDGYAVSDIASADDDAWLGLLIGKYLDTSSRSCFDALGYGEDELLHFSVGGTRPYSEACGKLDSFTHVDPNPRLVGEAPPRRFLVLKYEFPASHGIKITEHLRRSSKAPGLIAVVFSALTGGVETWWDIRAAKKLADFYRRARILDATKESGRAGFLACMPGAPVSGAKHSVERLLSKVGISLSAKIEKNYILYFDPPNKPALPTVPPIGRSL
jgi:hypothetical protein